MISIGTSLIARITATVMLVFYASGVVAASATAALAHDERAKDTLALCLYLPRDDQPLRRFPLDAEATFALSFIHSVSKTPVIDQYQLRDGEIIQTAEIFSAHGAGLPSFAGDIGATGWRHENGRFILDLDRPVGPIHLRIQAAYVNMLTIGDGAPLALADLGHKALTLAPCSADNHQE